MGWHGTPADGKASKSGVTKTRNFSDFLIHVCQLMLQEIHKLLLNQEETNT